MWPGVAPIILYLADRREVITISGLGHWPQAVSAEMFQKKHAGHIPTGILRTVVPSAPDAWITALEQYGTMSFGEVAAAAIRFARDGFPIHAFTASIIKANADKYRRWPSNAAIYLPGGQAPQPGRHLQTNRPGRHLAVYGRRRDARPEPGTKGRSPGGPDGLLSRGYCRSDCQVSRGERRAADRQRPGRVSSRRRTPDADDIPRP